MTAETQIVVPCYNEEKRLRVSEFVDFARANPNVSFVFVNDGSTDRTVDVLLDLVAEVGQGSEVVDLKNNGGKAEAVRQGMLHAFKSESSFVGFWDADLATPLDAIGPMLERLKEKPRLDLVMGARVQLLGRLIKRKMRRHYLGRVFATFASLALGLAVYDTQCGAKIFRVHEKTKSWFAEAFCSRWIFDVEILARMTKDYGERVVERVYEFPLLNWEDVAGSKVKPTDFLVAAGELLKIRNKYF